MFHEFKCQRTLILHLVKNCIVMLFREGRSSNEMKNVKF